MARDGRGLRLGVLGIVAISLFATLFARLWYLQMMSPERLDQQVQTSRVRTVQLAPDARSASSTATGWSWPTTGGCSR